jgi:hypothetical protein
LADFGLIEVEDAEIDNADAGVVVSAVAFSASSNTGADLATVG